MKIRIVHALLLTILLLCISCGGGTSGTAIGPGEGITRFSGLLVDQNGAEVSAARITLLNTDDVVETDEAGAFELSTMFVGGDATFRVEVDSGQSATLVVQDIPAESSTVEVTILFDSNEESATLLSLTLAARIVRSCSPLFLNTRTIRQTAVVPEGLVCTIEVTIKSDGVPVNDLVFELQRRGCASEDPWQFLSVGTTGSSGPGVGEVDFSFRNDEQHCVYRVIGPLNRADSNTVSAQLHTLRKQRFDLE